MRVRRLVAVLARMVVVGTVASGAVLGSARPAWAGDNDLVLARLGNIVNDGAGNPVDVVGSNLAFRSLASELGVVMAPHLLTPSDTLGFGGFQFAVDYAYTSINDTAYYWRALASSPDPASDTISHGNMLMPTLGLFMRKGIWFPLPSFEFGLGAVHLLDSRIWAAQGYVKFALHEGFHDLPIPSAAVRGGASRIMGTDQIDLTVASVDVSLSKDFGLQGSVTLSPYGGWNHLWIVPRSEVIDKTPQIDPFDMPADINMNFAFKDQANITRNRFFGGLKLKYYVFALTAEAMITTAGGSTDDRIGTDFNCTDSPTNPASTTGCDAKDQAGAQETYTISFAFDF
jgi:hypothetical protein